MFTQIPQIAHQPFGKSLPQVFTNAFDLADLPIDLNDFRVIVEDDDARCIGFAPDEKKVSFVRNQDLVPVEEYGTAAMAWELWRSGASIVFHYLQRYQPAIAELCQVVANAVGEPVHANAYWTPPGHQGFPLHSDPDSVIAMQLFGNKQWPFFTPKAKSPDDTVNISWIHTEGRTQEIAPPEQAARLLHVSPGDVLWSPRGWGHYAIAGDEESLHISLGILHPEIGKKKIDEQYPVYPQH